MNDQTAVSPIANGILDDAVSANHTDDMMMDQGAEVPETTENQEDGQQEDDQEKIDDDDEEEEEHNASRLELEEDNNEEEEEDEEEEEGSSRKRQRRSTSSFTPADFKHEPHRPIEIPAGRGVKLGDIGPIHSNVNKRNSTDPILLSLHKFLLGGPGGCLGKGRTSKNLVKKHILDFSGYLPPLKKDTDVVENGEDNVQEEKEQEEQEEGHDVVKEETGEEKEQDQGEEEGAKVDGEEAREEEEVKAGEEEGKEKETEGEGKGEEGEEGEMEDDEEEEMQDEEEEAEERMIAKAEKLSLPLLKSFCDILCLDRRPVDGKVPNKNMLIDRLLDFLAEPSPDGIDAEACSPKKRGRKPKNQQQQHKEESGMDVDEEEEVVTPKRKRGRPRKQRDESAEDSETKVPKKRGRPRKQKEETPAEHGEDESGEDEDGDKKENGMSADALMEKDLRKFARSYTFLFFDEKASMEHAFELATEKFGSKLDDGKKEMLTALLMKAKGTPKKK